MKKMKIIPVLITVIALFFTNKSIGQLQDVPDLGEHCYNDGIISVYDQDNNLLNYNWLVGCIDSQYTYVYNYFDYTLSNAYIWKVEIYNSLTSTWSVAFTEVPFIPPFNVNSSVNWNYSIPNTFLPGYYRISLETHAFANGVINPIVQSVNYRTMDFFGPQNFNVTVMPGSQSCYEINLTTDYLALISSPCSDPAWSGGLEQLVADWDDGSTTTVHESRATGTHLNLPINHSYTTSGQKTVTFTQSGECGGNSRQVTFWVGPPQVNISSTLTSLCSNSPNNVAIISSNVAANTPCTYQWASTNGTITATTANINVTPTVTTTYSVTATDQNGCSGSSTITISVTNNCCPGSTITCNFTTKKSDILQRYCL